MKQSFHRRLVAAAVIGAVAACSSDAPVVPSGGSPLAGLSEVQPTDTSNATHQPTGQGPGYFRGTVVGQWDFVAGADSIAAAPRLAGVVVSIYERLPNGETGTLKGSVTTGADGKFELPTLAAGEYAVTFVPPENSIYRGSYAFGPLWANSSAYPWWVVLAKK